MIIKQKTCAGWDENSHPAFIWKQINGKKYCKVCALKLECIKSIPKISNKQKEKNKENTQVTKLLQHWFNSLWSKLPKNKFCTICKTPIYGENLSIYWDHLLEKSKYPELMFNNKNIVFVCGDCHQRKTNGFPLPKHKELIDKAKKEFLNEE